MPVLQPAELWRRSGRYDIDEVFKLQDRRGAELVLAMSHEENAHLPHGARGPLLPRPAEAALPLPDEGARRAAAARRGAAHARVHHEGRLLLRPRPRGPRRAPTSSSSRPTTGSSTAPGSSGTGSSRTSGHDGRLRRPRVHGARARQARTTWRCRTAATRPTWRWRAPRPQPVDGLPDALDAPEPVETPGATTDRRGGRPARRAGRAR